MSKMRLFAVFFLRLCNMKLKKWEVCVFIGKLKGVKKVRFIKVLMALEVWREIEIDTKTSLFMLLALPVTFICFLD